MSDVRFMLRFDGLQLDCNDHLFIYDGAHAVGTYKELLRRSYLYIGSLCPKRASVDRDTSQKRRFTSLLLDQRSYTAVRVQSTEYREHIAMEHACPELLAQFQSSQELLHTSFFIEDLPRLFYFGSDFTFRVTVLIYRGAQVKVIFLCVLEKTMVLVLDMFMKIPFYGLFSVIHLDCWLDDGVICVP
ncbi:hypothetical protein D910_03434 [Dendroctonus ponderosae]|uniref:Uncharacterized protein n=1 Tax=Dendroctonus ponderosae TaxID=77166 RepID=U4U7U6_DENPD|nr:hypothetical protein D910_03434 [Dendroctonus ponderosae]